MITPPISINYAGSNIKKGVNIVSTGFRAIWWGSVAYLAYTLYDYKTNSEKKADNGENLRTNNG